jgi:TusA-related sulfurtransferase
MTFKAVKQGNWFKLENTESVQNWLNQFEQGQTLDVTIDKPKIKRNLSQNALLHAMFQKIAKFDNNNDIARTKWQILIHLGYYNEFEIKGRLEKLPISTSKLEMKEFAELVDKVNHFAWEEYQLDLKPISQRGY